MNKLITTLASITVLAIFSAPAHSMAWTDDEVNDSLISTSPLVQQTQDSLWTDDMDANPDVYMPIGNGRLADLSGNEDSFWIQ